MSPNLESHVLGTPRPKKPLTKKDDEFGTPDHIFLPFHQELQFTIDAAATKENTKLPRYVTKKMDALSMDFKGERVWCNPPYSKHPTRKKGHVELFVRHFAHLCLHGDCWLACLLVPTKTEQSWFHELQGKFELRFIPGRISFLGGEHNARDTHMALIFRNWRWIWNGNQRWKDDPKSSFVEGKK